MPGSPWNLYVFREAKRRIPGPRLLRELLRCLDGIRGGSEEALVSALVRAGEIESAIADHSPDRTPWAVAVSEELASGLAGAPVDRDRIRAGIDRLTARGGVPDSARLSPPESFSYYGLHPRDVIAALRHWPDRADGSVAVIGIRTIGTTLSAVVRAALRARGVDAERITVRPAGPPFARRLELGGDVLTFVRRHVARRSRFVVVDEGPGVSGTSFLSVGERVRAEGGDRITFLTTREIDAAELQADDGARRWRAFDVRVVRSGSSVPADAAQPLAGGAWRDRFLGAAAAQGHGPWPPSWYGLERAKFLDRDGRVLFKFEGLGRYGDEARRRVATLAAAGFSCDPEEAGSGFVAYRVVAGRPARAEDADAATLDRLADYCAFRARALGADLDEEPRELGEMLAVNAAEELDVDALPALDIAVPVIADARMMPHEWIRSTVGLVKTDAASHGDDQRFPGACDIAWDLAGTILEWRLDVRAAEHLLRRYEARSGDRPRRRLGPYLCAYALSRAAECRMAAAAMHRTEEAARFLAEYARWRAALTRYAPRGISDE